MIVAQLIKKFPAFYETTVSTKTRHWALFQVLQINRAYIRSRTSNVATERERCKQIIFLCKAAYRTNYPALHA